MFFGEGERKETKKERGVFFDGIRVTDKVMSLRINHYFIRID